MYFKVIGISERDIRISEFKWTEFLGKDCIVGKKYGSILKSIPNVNIKYLEGKVEIKWGYKGEIYSGTFDVDQAMKIVSRYAELKEDAEFEAGEGNMMRAKAIGQIANKLLAGVLTKSQGKYSNNGLLDVYIDKNVDLIKSGITTSFPILEKVIKKTETGILLASKKHQEARFRPGNELTTYTGVDEKGIPIQETWGGGVATIKEGDVILKNASPITYPAGHILAGQQVKGYFDENNKFVVNQNSGQEKLYNEYVSDQKFVKEAYGIDADTSWKSGYKLVPSYAMKIPESIKDDVIIKTPNAEIHVKAGDYVILDTKKGQVISVQGIAGEWFDSTYINFQQYQEQLQQASGKNLDAEMEGVMKKVQKNQR
ncbi:MAG: hypothetical protein PHV30_02245 [Candidatus Margulisbacteria bacterium]|nr:hypothetical protein [Candidatus Margulisiibacteriota bacterium]